MEILEIQLAELQVSLSSRNNLKATKRKEIIEVIGEVQEGINSLRRKMSKTFSDMIKDLEEIEGNEDALSD